MDKRYVVTFESYVYAPNDYMARKRAHDINKTINIDRFTQDSTVNEMVEQPFGTLGNRELKNISEPTSKENKDLPF